MGKGKPQEKGKYKDKGKQRPALAAKHAEQCPYWVRKGCNDPSNCALGRHDQDYYMKGPPPRDPKGKPGAPTKPPFPKGKGASSQGGGGRGKGDGGKGGGKGGSKGGKGADDHKKPLPCYPHMEGRCNDPNCNRGHGPFTNGEKKAYEAWKAKRDSDAAAAPAAAAQDNKGKPPADPKGKHKGPKAPAKPKA